MVVCCVPDCNNRYQEKGKSIKFHRLPKDLELRKKWLARIKNPALFKLTPEKQYNTHRICDAHFSDEVRAICRTHTGLRRGAVPDLHLPGFQKKVKPVRDGNNEWDDSSSDNSDDETNRMARKYCAVPDCEDSFGRKFARFEVKDTELFQKWIDAVKNPKFIGKTRKQMHQFRVCDRHFEPKYLLPEPYPGSNRRTVTYGAVPTLHLPKEMPPLEAQPIVASQQLPIVCCCVVGCRNEHLDREGNRRFHHFPIQEKLRSLWIERTNPNLKKLTSSALSKHVVCDEHFDTSQYQTADRLKLNRNAVPTRNLPAFVSISLLDSHPDIAEDVPEEATVVIPDTAVEPLVEVEIQKTHKLVHNYAVQIINPSKAIAQNTLNAVDEVIHIEDDYVPPPTIIDNDRNFIIVDKLHKSKKPKEYLGKRSRSGIVVRRVPAARSTTPEPPSYIPAMSKKIKYNSSIDLVLEDLVEDFTIPTPPAVNEEFNDSFYQNDDESSDNNQLYVQICRICVDSQENLRSIYEQTSLNMTICYQFLRTFPDMSLTNTNTYYLICEECSKKLDEVFKFRQLCISSYKKLHNFMQTQLSSEETDLDIRRKDTDSGVQQTESGFEPLIKTIDCAKAEPEDISRVTNDFDLLVEKSENALTIDDLAGAFQKPVDIEKMWNYEKEGYIKDDVTDVRNRIAEEVVKSTNTVQGMDPSEQISIHTNNTNLGIEISATSQDSNLLKQENDPESDLQAAIKIENDIPDCGDVENTPEVELLKMNLPSNVEVLKGFRCTVCQKSFLNFRHLYIHKKVKHNMRIKQIFMCKICHKTFEYSSNLQKHMLRHTRPFSCTYCPKRFASELNLKTHETVKHIGERPYSCDVCGKGFPLPQNLKAHKILHEGGLAKNFICEVCGLMFRSMAILENHRTIHTGEKNYKCTECNKAFRTPTQLKYHSSSHIAEKLYTCDVCDNKFKTANHLYKHKRTTHLPKKEFECHICFKKFRFKQSCKSHIRLHTGETPYQCPLCQEEFVRAEQLRKHKIVAHTKPKFKCEECPSIFYFKTSLDKHKLLHSDVKSFTCETCGKSFKHKKSLWSHIRQVHDNIRAYECYICKKKFKQRSHLMNHFQVFHCEEKVQYECEICGKVCSTKYALTSHQKKHAPVKPYVCGKCTEGFDDQESLDQHTCEMKTCEICFEQVIRKQLAAHRQAHARTSETVCPVCGIRLRTMSVRAHMRIHTDERPYSCRYCDRTFRQHGSLKTHMSVHTGARAYECRVCTRTFRQVSHLRAHVNSHYGIKPHVCELCGKAYSQKRDLTAHHHNMHYIPESLDLEFEVITS